MRYIFLPMIVITLFFKQQQAAVAFGTNPAGYAPMAETPSYATYLSGRPQQLASASSALPFNSRASASNMATYSSLQDVADEEDDGSEDAF